MTTLLELNSSDFEIVYESGKYGALCFDHAVQVSMLSKKDGGDSVSSSIHFMDEFGKWKCNICTGKSVIGEFGEWKGCNGKILERRKTT